MKKSKIPTILGVIFLTIGLAAGVLLIRNRQIFRLGATQEAVPKDVRIANTTDASFTVSWVTEKASLGFISWGENENSLTRTEEDEVGATSITHTVSIKSLAPDKTYFFKINSGGVEYDNNGLTWQNKTGPTIPQPAKSNLISGTILTTAGAPAKNALVYVTLGGGATLSTISSQNGSWIINLASARTSNLTSLIDINEKTTLIEISVNAGSDEVSSAQIYLQSARPVPPMIIGQVHDFKNLPPSETGEIPKATVGLPEESTPSSGFEIEQSSTPSATTVTLESVTEGETISSTQPEFFGEAPAGTSLTITVESEVITDNVTVPSSGEWKWTPPSDLPEGTHKITVRWKDASGILRTLTRNFIVSAAEGPAFEATPSATLTPTVTPTGTISATPTATKKPTPTATPTSTPYATPESGSLTPTLLLSIMGIGVIAFAIMLWKKSEI